MLTHQEIVINLRDAITNNRDIECIQEFTVDFYTLFGLARHSFNETKLNIAFKKLALLTHPDKGDYPNRKALMQYINNAKDTLWDPRTRSVYDTTLPSLPQDETESSETEEENSGEHRSESPWRNPYTGPTTYGPNATNRDPGERPRSTRRYFTSGFNPLVPPRNSDTQNCYLMFFCIADGSREDRYTQANTLIEEYVEKKKRGTGNLIQNARLSNKTETVTFRFSSIREYQYDFDYTDESYLVVTFSTDDITLDDDFIKRASSLYTENHPECEISVAKTGWFNCCF